jgi:hypothetical protein
MVRGCLPGSMLSVLLDRSTDLLDGLEISRANVLHGATLQYVDLHLRPEVRQVRAMADAADKLCGPGGTDPRMTRLPLLGTKTRVGGYGGLRLASRTPSARSTCSLTAAVVPEQGEDAGPALDMHLARRTDLSRSRPTGSRTMWSVLPAVRVTLSRRARRPWPPKRCGRPAGSGVRRRAAHRASH